MWECSVKNARRVPKAKGATGRYWRKSTDSVRWKQEQAEVNVIIFEHGHMKEDTSQSPFVGAVYPDSLRQAEYKYLNVIFPEKKFHK